MNIIEMHLNNTTKQRYAESIAQLLDILINEGQPYLLLVIYETLADDADSDDQANWWERMYAAYQVLGIVGKSQWSRKAVITGLTAANEMFILEVLNQISNDWTIVIEDDLETARHEAIRLSQM